MPKKFSMPGLNALALSGGGKSFGSKGSTGPKGASIPTGRKNKQKSKFPMLFGKGKM
jgi:hypothetical protein